MPIQLRSDKKGEGDAFDKVGDQYLPTIVPGVSVPLRQVSTIEGGWNEGQIVRRNGVRTLSVFAEVTRGTNQNAMQKRIERVMESHIIPTLPEGCRLRRRPATHAPDLPDLGYNGRGRGAHDHQRQFPLDADGCGDLLGNGLLDDLGGHHPACFLLEDIRE